MKWVADTAIQNSTYHKGCIWNTHFGEMGGHRSHHHSYMFSIVTSALIIRPQFAIECLRHSNQQGVVTFDHFPLV